MMPNDMRPAGIVLAPGASAGRDQPALVAIDAVATSRGLLVERVDFPYRLAGRRSPDPPHVLVATVRDAALGLAERASVGPERIVLGGRSLGGRMCSAAVAEGHPAAALVLVSYPLHPPGRPERRRDAHFPDIGVPCLFVSGTRDAFARPDELEASSAAIRGPVSHAWIDGGDHGLRRKDAQVADLVGDWLGTLGSPTD
jgi:predicted alpha/beta-hydrolase family hydrolase